MQGVSAPPFLRAAFVPPNGECEFAMFLFPNSLGCRTRFEPLNWGESPIRWKDRLGLATIEFCAITQAVGH